MSLENELNHYKMELQNEMEKLAKFESLNPSEMDEMQLNAYNRGIASVKKSIEEIKHLISEICEEMGVKNDDSEEENVWIEFEAWMDDEISICGYMALDEADDEHPLNFYGYDGLECGSHISNTRTPSFTEDQLFKWEVLVDWFATTDVIQHLVDFAEREMVLKFRTESDWGRIFDVELYINCSKTGGE